jgi:hypothetical protein
LVILEEVKLISQLANLIIKKLRVLHPELFYYLYKIQDERTMSER